MLADFRMAWVITRREVRDQFRDWRIITPIIALTVVFPALMNFTARQAVGFVERYGAPVIGDRLIPFLLMVVGFFPISISLVIALESFVGEKERRSIEPLLCSPLTDGQLYLGKLLASLVPPLLASYLGITVYLVSLYFQIGWYPEPIFLLQIFLLTTVQAIVMVSGAVVVSTQTTSTRAANLLASFIIIPMAFLIQGEAMVMFWAIYSALWWAILGLLVIASLLIRTGLAQFNREELLGRELDQFNIRRGWGIFIRAFIGQARNLKEWYLKEIPRALRKLTYPVLGMLIALSMGIWAGVDQAGTFVIPDEAFNFGNISDGLIEGLEAIQFISASGVIIVWLHNLRVVILATLLGIFSFGVLGVLALMMPIMLISFITANVASAGLSASDFVIGLVLPHGILEIAAIVLTGAAILHVGATLATNTEGKTIAEALLSAMAVWAQVVIGLVIPLFLAAALVEVLITPHIAVLLLGN